MLKLYIKIGDRDISPIISNILLVLILGNSLQIYNNSLNDNQTKATISGCVVDNITTLAPTDAPNKRIYKIKMENGSLFNVTYTAYPPSPAGEVARKNITLNFINGTILPGNYLIAYGNYDRETKTLTVANEGDFIQTRIKSSC